ncbi:MAG: FHA domain-containing protein [Clostridia bacterium]|nr:FHA domain-containing protein [Clostridia bacterium]
MSSDAYELAALTVRYVLCALMLLIVFRAAKGALTDSRRATRLRRLSPMTGLSGELIVLEGLGKVHTGMRYPVIREGMIGTSRRADVRIRHASVRRRHAYFQLTEKGLHIRGHANTTLRDAHNRAVRELTLHDGDRFRLGSIRLMLVLNFADVTHRRARMEAETEGARDFELFHEGNWEDATQEPISVERRPKYQSKHDDFFDDFA